MLLLVIRHAIAEDRETFAAAGRDDALRPLTEQGRRKMRRAARGLRRLVPTIDTLVTSGLTRAQETAAIVRDEYQITRVETAPELEPERPVSGVITGLTRYTGELVAIVGHEPQLSRLVTYLVSGVDRSGVALKKGGACLLEFDGTAKPAGGELLWAVRPGILRDLAG
jgi:phosphohistidine phosphatase